MLTTAHQPFDIRIFHKECRSLKAAGYEVILIAQHSKEEAVDSIRIKALPNPKNRMERMLLLTIKCLVKALRQKADVYQFHDPELIPVGLLLKLFTGKKVVYDIHEDYSSQTLSKKHIPKSFRRPLAHGIRILEYLSSRCFDGIVAATDNILDNFSYHKRAISVRNFPRLSHFPGIKTQKSDKWFRVVYIGIISKIRGISQIIQAMHYIPSDRRIKILLCGEFYPSDYASEAKKVPGYETVENLGWVEPREIIKLLNISDVGIVCFLPEPNHVKAMPNKLFEYMAAGLPVVVSNFPLWKKVVEENSCGIAVDPRNPEKIAKAIEYFMNNPDKKKEMGENGRRAILGKYNWEKEKEKLLQLYRSLLSNDA